MKVLIHFDEGVGVGLGHMSRCIALAKQLNRVGHDVFILTDTSTKLSSFTKNQGFKTLEISINPNYVANIAVEMDIDCLIVDSYKWDSSDFKVLNGKWLNIVFDDDAFRNLPVDALINGSLAAKDLKYKTSLNTELWLGPEFQLVKEFFSNLPSRKINNVVRRVVVMVGGDDSFSLVPSEFKQLCEGIRTAWGALGCINYKRKASEEENVKFRRSLYFVKELKSGDLITTDSIRSIRPGFGLAPNNFDILIGKQVNTNVKIGTPVSWEYII